MRKTSTRALRRWLRDMGLGAMIFLAVPALASGLSEPQRNWGIGAASAGDVMATRAVEVTSPPGPDAENAIVAAAQLRPGGPASFLGAVAGSCRARPDVLVAGSGEPGLRSPSAPRERGRAPWLMENPGFEKRVRGLRQACLKPYM